MSLTFVLYTAQASLCVFVWLVEPIRCSKWWVSQKYETIFKPTKDCLICVHTVNHILTVPGYIIKWEVIPSMFLQYYFLSCWKCSLSTLAHTALFLFLFTAAVSPSCGQWAWFWRGAQRRCVPPHHWSCAHRATRARLRLLWAPAHNRTTESFPRRRSPSSTASSSC